MFGIPKILIISFALVSIIFVSFPEIDIWFSALFYDPVTGFYLATQPWAMFVYHGIRVLTTLMVLALIILILYSALKKSNTFGYSSRVYVYLLAVLIVGPGVLSTITKDHWHRARPATIEQFGGDKQFTPAFVISDQCDVNCSFISGHPTTMYYFVAFALIAPLAYRRKIIGFAVLSGLFVGWIRIIQGGHFLSDVITSGFLVIITAYLLHRLFFPHHTHIRKR